MKLGGTFFAPKNIAIFKIFFGNFKFAVLFEKLRYCSVYYRTKFNFEKFPNILKFKIYPYLPSTLIIAFLCGFLFFQLDCTKKVNEFDFDKSLAWKHLAFQCSLGPRFPGSEAHNKLRDYIIKFMEERGAKIEIIKAKGIMGAEEVALDNIVASFNPRERKRIFIATHYDTRPWAEMEIQESKKSNPIIGANDGASGVAVLLELARVISKWDKKIAIDFIFTDGEDLGKEGTEGYCQGSKAIAKELSKRKPLFGIVVDMVGDKELEIKKEPLSKKYAASIVEDIWSVAEELGIEEFKEEESEAIYDDHVPFIMKGIPAVLIIDFDYKFWHTLKDTQEACSAESLEKVGKVLEKFIKNLQSKI